MLTRCNNILRVELTQRQERQKQKVPDKQNVKMLKTSKMLKCFRRLEIENLYKKVNHEVAWGGSYINYVSIGKFNHRDAFFVVRVIDFRKTAQ